jgi:hypothetical protein
MNKRIIISITAFIILLVTYFKFAYNFSEENHKRISNDIKQLDLEFTWMLKIQM